MDTLSHTQDSLILFVQSLYSCRFFFQTVKCARFIAGRSKQMANGIRFENHHFLIELVLSYSVRLQVTHLKLKRVTLTSVKDKQCRLNFDA